MKWSCSECFFAGALIGSDHEAFERFRREELLRLEETLRKALLVVIAQERGERLAIGLEAVRPEVVAHERARVLDVLREPRERRFQRRGDVEVLVALALRLH